MKKLSRREIEAREAAYFAQAVIDCNAAAAALGIVGPRSPRDMGRIADMLEGKVGA